MCFHRIVKIAFKLDSLFSNTVAVLLCRSNKSCTMLKGCIAFIADFAYLNVKAGFIANTLQGHGKEFIEENHFNYKEVSIERDRNRLIKKSFGLFTVIKRSVIKCKILTLIFKIGQESFDGQCTNVQTRMSLDQCK